MLVLFVAKTPFLQLKIFRVFRMIWWVWDSLKYSWWESSDRWLGNREYVVRNASRMEIRRRARRGVSSFWAWVRSDSEGLGKGEEVVRRVPEVGWDSRCCVKVATIIVKVATIIVIIIIIVICSSISSGSSCSSRRLLPTWESLGVYMYIYIYIYAEILLWPLLLRQY